MVLTMTPFHNGTSQAEPSITMDNNKHFIHSGFREKLIEHLLIGELLKQSWKNGDCTIEISRPEVDRAGYDLIVECNGYVRHVQLKGAHLGAKAARQSVQISLGAKPSGCVVWVFFNPKSLDLGPFMFFGGEPGERLPSLSAFKTAKHTKGNAQGVKAEKPNHRYINKGQFTRVDTIGDLWYLLFGDPSLAIS